MVLLRTISLYFGTITKCTLCLAYSIVSVNHVFTIADRVSPCCGAFGRHGCVFERHIACEVRWHGDWATNIISRLTNGCSAIFSTFLSVFGRWLGIDFIVGLLVLRHCKQTLFNLLPSKILDFLMSVLCFKLFDSATADLVLGLEQAPAFINLNDLLSLDCG